jgi:TPR repeat protein
MRYLGQSADGGNVFAQAVYGALLLAGMGVPEDVARGKDYLQRSVDGGHAFGQATLGGFLSDGPEADLDLAVRYLRLAAGQGNALGQCLFAEWLRGGEHIRADPPRAVKLLKKAARQEYGDAQLEYAKCLENGIGCERNLLKASLYYWLAMIQDVKGAERGFNRCLAARR